MVVAATEGAGKAAVGRAAAATEAAAVAAQVTGVRVEEAQVAGVTVEVGEAGVVLVVLEATVVDWVARALTEARVPQVDAAADAAEEVAAFSGTNSAKLAAGLARQAQRGSSFDPRAHVQC